MRPRTVASQFSSILKRVSAAGLRPVTTETQGWVKLAFAVVHDQSASMPATQVGANCQLYPACTPPTRALVLRLPVMGNSPKVNTSGRGSHRPLTLRVHNPPRSAPR